MSAACFCDVIYSIYHKIPADTPPVYNEILPLLELQIINHNQTD